MLCCDMGAAYIDCRCMCEGARGLPMADMGEAIDLVILWFDDPGTKPIGYTLGVDPMRWLPAEDVGRGGENGLGEN